MGETILPEKENLRRAVRWISEQGTFSVKVVDEASLRFDLSPADAAFLLRHFAGKKEGEQPPTLTLPRKGGGNRKGGKP